jgi:methyl-accepting chemotaxis protein
MKKLIFEAGFVKKIKSMTSNKYSLKHSIKAKLLVAFSITVLLMGILSVVTYFIINSSIGKLNNMVETSIQFNTIICEVNDIVKSTDKNENKSYLSDVSNALLTGNNADEVKYEKLLNDSLSRIDKAFGLLKNTYITDSNGLSELQLCINSYNSFKDAIKNLKQSYTKKDWETATEKKGYTERSGNYLIGSIQDATSYELSQNAIEKEAMNREAATTGIFIFVFIIVLGVLSLTAGILLTNNITKTIKKLVGFSTSIADGDLTIGNVNVKSKDEIGMLAKSYNGMAENLKLLSKRSGPAVTV